MSGKTVSDEALRKFVAASRGAHDDRAALRAQMLSLRGVLASREAEIALLKRSLLDAEAAALTPSATPSAASIAWNALRDLTDPLGEDGVKIMGHVRVFAQRQYEAGLAEGSAARKKGGRDAG